MALGKPKMPMESALINPQELLGYNLNKTGAAPDSEMKDMRISTNVEEFDMPMQQNERRGTINNNPDMADDDDEEDMRSIAIDSLVIYDRSQSIKPPTLKDFNFIQKLGNGSFGNVSSLDSQRYTWCGTFRRATCTL